LLLALTGQPTNGTTCETAQEILPPFEGTPLPTATTNGGSVFDFVCGDGNDSPAVFYQFVGNGARMRISTCSDTTDFNTALILDVNSKTCSGYQPFCRAPSATPDVDCDRAPAGNAVYLDFYSVLNQLYLLAVQSRDTGGSGNFGLSFLEYKRPQNDLCENATQIQLESDAMVGATVNATLGTKETITCGSGNISPTVFYQFLGTGAQVRLSTCSNVTNFNTNIVVDVESKTCGGYQPFCRAPSATPDTACGSTKQPGQAVFVDIETELNQIYLVAVQSRDLDGKGDFSLSLQSLGSSSSPTTVSPIPAPITAATGFPAPAIGNPTPAPITATTGFPIQAPITAATGFPSPAIGNPAPAPMTADSSNAPTGFPKAAVGFPTKAPMAADSSNAKTGFPLATLVVIPIAIILGFGFFVYCRRQARQSSHNEPSSSISDSINKQQHNASLGASAPEETSHSAAGSAAVPEEKSHSVAGSAAPQSVIANPMEQEVQVSSMPEEEGGAKIRLDGPHDLPQTKDQCRSVATDVPLASAVAVEPMRQLDP